MGSSTATFRVHVWDFGLITVPEGCGRWVDEWKDICSRRLAIVNVKADLDMLFAGTDGPIASDDTNLGRTVR